MEGDVELEVMVEVEKEYSRKWPQKEKEKERQGKIEGGAGEDRRRVWERRRGAGEGGIRQRSMGGMIEGGQRRIERECKRVEEVRGRI
jgi:hypothetical protein